MIFLLALRNIARNRKNSAIVALLIAVIVFIFFTGNSIIQRSNLSLHEAFIKSLTGDVMIQKKADVSMNLFGANTPVIDEFFVIPVFPAYEAVMDIVRAESGIAEITSQVSGKAYLDVYGVRSPALLCGVDSRTYFSMFPGIFLNEGRTLRAGEYGAMITLDRAQKIEKETGIYPRIGDPLLFTSGGNLGFKIREVPLTGIFNYQNPGLFMNEIVIIDPQTVRVLNSIQVASLQEISHDNPRQTASLFSFDIDDIFNMETSISLPADEEDFSVDFLMGWLAESPAGNDANQAGGDWNFIIINLNDNVSSNAFIKSLNKKIDLYGVTAVDWRTAVGSSAILLLLIQVLFNAGMFLVCVTGVITVINILLISVFRRTREIGTLRAIGSSDFYISSLILQENIILSAVSGAAGILAGLVFIRWINATAFNIPNELVASLLGGSLLRLDFIPHTAFLSFILAIILGVIVSIYPVHVTLRIEPVEAVRQG
ncbi:MAG: ABC transporter permease [Treponema sp.]|jgi:ABC-type lipoprotein release transport system permease subunit|nr:ABC transporter permease [Treponema sp.]